MKSILTHSNIRPVRGVLLENGSVNFTKLSAEFSVNGDFAFSYPGNQRSSISHKLPKI